MEKMKIQVDKDGRELKHSLDGKFPLTVEYQKLSYYAFGRCVYHWHPEMELLIVTEGMLEQQIGTEVFRLGAGEGVFINAHAMHGTKMVEHQDCSYRVVRFEPTLIGGGTRSRMYEKYISTMLSRDDVLCCVLRREEEAHKKMLSIIYDITAIYVKQDICYELEVLGLMLEFWNLLYKYIGELEGSKGIINKEMYKIQDALAYVQTYYKSPISLADIAESCALSKSACCRLFKKVLRQSPMDYVTAYRINQSFALIADEEYSITEAAYEAGFTSSSYFAEMFRKVTGMTPTQYKKAIKGK